MTSDFRITKTDGVEVIDTANRPPMIEVKDGKVNVKTQLITISRKHRFLMLFDLVTISWVSAIFVLIATLNNLSWIGILGMCILGGLMWICALGKTICDFRNWMFTMQMMNERMGDWYCEDVINICNSFISAGVKVAAEEVEKAKKGEEGKENGEAAQETKAE